MSLPRNLTPGDGQADDDDQQPDAAVPADKGARADKEARADEGARAGNGQAPGTARYAFAGPVAGVAAPAPAVVVPSEVITEPDDAAAQSGDLAAESGAPVAESAPAAAAPDPRKRSPGLDADGPAEPPAPTQPGPDFAAPLLDDTAELRARWQRVQGDFVDDPQAAVSDAADLVGQTAQALVDALRERQRQLRTAWQRGAADGQATAAAPGAMDTEHLRLVMQRYRALFNQLCRPS